jgi:hypothetical protein
MKSSKFILGAFVAVLFASCGTYTYQESTARYVEPTRAGFVTPIVADMVVQEDVITNEVEVFAQLKGREINQIMRAEMQGIESPLVLSWKKYALAQTLKKFKADDIVSPTFEIAPSRTKQDVLVITVTGHLATYHNYRKATQADVDLMKPFIESKSEIKVNTGMLLQRAR